MDNGNAPDLGDLDELLGDIDEFNKGVELEEKLADLASLYVDVLPEGAISTISDYSDYVKSSLDELVEEERAIKIVKLLNRYVVQDPQLLVEEEQKNGKTSANLSKILELFSDLSEINAQNIFELKSNSYDCFIHVLKMAYKSNKHLITQFSTAHMAMLRFHVLSLLFNVDNIEKTQSKNILMAIKVAYSIGYLMKEIHLCVQLDDDDYLKKMHSVSQSRVQQNAERRDYTVQLNLAKSAWSEPVRCKLLHSQMLYLLESVIGLKADLSDKLNKELKKVAPADRKFGTVNKKLIEICPCDDRNICPIMKQHPLDKQYDIPTSKRTSRKKSYSDK